MLPVVRRLGAAALLLALAACTTGEPVEAVVSETAPPATAPAASPSPEPAPSEDPETGTADDEQVAERPAWLGTRVLPAAPGGFGQVQPTPPELTDRRLPPPVVGDPPAPGFTPTITPVPDDVAARSTWTEQCPVGLHELRYVTVAFWGFDERAHIGELLVHADAAADVAGVFAELFAARFPIEEMRIVEPAELDAPPTGDGNNTTAFVCRPTRGSGAWSEHAFGLAVDVNPFHNPYLKGDLVLPELAGSYTDRAHHRPGMVQPGDVVTAAFARIGWRWGGDWSSLKDWMHFSASGR